MKVYIVDPPYYQKYLIFLGDMQSAFLNIWVAEEDHDFLRFLCVKDVDQNGFELVVKRFSVAVLKYLGLNEDLVMKVLNDFYMDDSISGSDSSEKCFEFYSQIKKKKP